MRSTFAGDERLREKGGIPTFGRSFYFYYPYLFNRHYTKSSD
jgi:hypothetical protein